MSESIGCQPIVDLGQFMVNRARSVDTGEVVEIIAKTPFGIEWRSSICGDWFMAIPSCKDLVENWDEASSVGWFWDATFKDESTSKAFTIVPPRFMREIKEWLEDGQF